MMKQKNLQTKSLNQSHYPLVKPHHFTGTPDDVFGVLEWCIENTKEGYSGEERPDLRALVMLAKR